MSATKFNSEQTLEIIKRFYNDCLRFWKLQKAYRQEDHEEEIDPIDLAIKDVSRLKSNPFVPGFQKLDATTIKKWVDDMLVKSENEK